MKLGVELTKCIAIKANSYIMMFVPTYLHAYIQAHKPNGAVEDSKLETSKEHWVVLANKKST